MLRGEEAGEQAHSVYDVRAGLCDGHTQRVHGGACKASGRVSGCGGYVRGGALREGAVGGRLRRRKRTIGEQRIKDERM